MRIRAIRGRGLASLAEPFELDLDADPIRSAGVFVIGGPTGAGKSTILDALCLALFDRAPRLARAPQRDVVKAGEDRGRDGSTEPASDALRASDPRSLVRRGARHAYAEVDFEGRRGGLYRARWEVRSVQRRAGGWTLGKPAMSLASLDARRPATPGAEDRALRVGTTKTDVLAQIEARLGLDFGQFCRSVLLPQGELASFLEAPDDERARLLERVTGTEIYSSLSRIIHERAAEKAREARDQLLAIAAVPVLAEAERAELTAARDEAGLELARASKRLAEITEAERAHEAVRVHEAELARAERDLDDVTRQLGIAEPRRAEIALAQRAREIRVERQARDTAHAERLQAEAERVAVLSRLERAEPELDAIEAHVEHERERVRGLERDAIDLELALARHEAALAAWSAESGREEALRAGRRAAEVALEAALRRERDARKSSDAFARELATLEAEAAADGEASIEPIAELVRRELRRGEACPVCGSLEHPAHAASHVAPGKRGARRGEGPEARAALAALEARQARQARVTSLRVEASRHETTAQLRREESERARASLDEARAAADEAAALRTTSRRAIEAEHGVEPPAQRRASHAKGLATARARLVSLEHAATERRATVAALRGARDVWFEREQLAQRELARAEAALEDAMARHGLTVLDVEAASQLDDRDVARWASELERLDRRRDEQRAITDERRRRLEDAVRSVPEGLFGEGALFGDAHGGEPRRGPPAREEIEAARRRAERERAHAEQARAIAEARLEDDLARREEQSRRREALAALEGEARTWQELSRAAGSADGKKLRVLVQSMALDILVAHANQQLAALAPRYRLARRGASPGSLALDVLDAELPGGPRSTSSLSGGERFLVSLSLALGLGTMTAERDEVGSLFLDEGFGSLDEESLEQALEALDALRQAGRQIGVVSHVARLAERFDVRVEVRPSGPGASTVHVAVT